MKITKGMRVQFENGRDTLRGVVASLHSDPKRPDMEETWTIFADTMLVKTRVVDADGNALTTAGKPLETHDGKPVIDRFGNAKHAAGEPVFNEEWLVLVDDNGQQPCDRDGVALHKNFAGEPLQLVKHGVPVPFRVRARRLTVL